MEERYINFTTDDFIADEFFLRWVKSPDKETNDFWQKWIADHPEKCFEVEEACAFINNLKFNTDHPAKHDVESALQRSLELIEDMENREMEQQARAWYLKRSALLVAALFIGLIFFAVSLFNDREPTTIEIITGAHEIKSILLPDSTSITLNANSSIKYTSNISKIDVREVWLKGEAFFDVKHIETDQNARKFIVHSDDLNVEVLGTSFNIKKRKDVYNVSLNTGKIKVKLKDDSGSTIFMKPGEFFQYSASEKYIVKKTVKPELYSDWKDKKMVLNDVPFSEIATLIHDTYGYNTIIEDNGLNEEKISGTILLDDENVFLETLSVALNINIIKKDNDLIFQYKTQ